MRGEGHLKYKGVVMDLVFDAEAIIPGLWTLSNGDPGYPSEGGEFYIEQISIEGVNCTELLEPLMEDIEELYLATHRL